MSLYREFRTITIVRKYWFEGIPALNYPFPLHTQEGRTSDNDVVQYLDADNLTDMRQVRLLAAEDPLSPDTLDCHPLVREHFGEKLERSSPTAWREAHAAWRWDQGAYDRVRAEWGHLGAPTCYMPRATVQDLYINTMGVEQAVFAIHDWAAEVEGYFAALN